MIPSLITVPLYGKHDKNFHSKIVTLSIRVAPRTQPPPFYVCIKSTSLPRLEPTATDLHKSSCTLLALKAHGYLRSLEITIAAVVFDL